MSAEETLARRQTFWELITFDRLLVRDTHCWPIAELNDHCSHSGPGDHRASHPCTLTAKCRSPTPMNRTWKIHVRVCPCSGNHFTQCAIVLLSKHTFAEECIVPVLDYVIVSRTQPSYASCLRISKKLQEHSMPGEVLNNADFDAQRGRAAHFYARCTMKATALLILHRDSCNRALIEAINDDFSQSRYAESVDVT
jgi:hypothetical protein